MREQMLKLHNATGRRFQQQCAWLEEFKNSFYRLKEADIVALFGPKVHRQANWRDTFVLSLYDPGGFAGSTLSDPHKPRQDHLDYYEIGDFAAADFFYDVNGALDWISFFFRIDDAFPRLKSWNDLKARIEWDDARLSKLEHWVAEHRQTGAETPQQPPNRALQPAPSSFIPPPPSAADLNIRGSGYLCST